MSDRLVKFISSTVGRDRINRFVQYYAKYYVWELQRSGGDKESIDRFSKLQSAIGQTRKLMRVGRQIEFYRTIVKSLAIKDSVIKYTTIAKNVFLALWLAHDSLQWAHAAGVYKLSNIKDITNRAFKCWLLALLVSFAGDIYKLRVNLVRSSDESKAVARAKKTGEKDETAKKSLASLRALSSFVGFLPSVDPELNFSERTKILLATVQDGLDILIPASGLEYVQVESGIVGLAGAFTSVLGGYTHWNSL